MLVDSIGFSGAWLVKPNIYEDARGFFYEGYSRKDFLEYGLPDNFIQDGYSYNAKKNTFRGLHYQRHPFAQALYIKVLQGAIYDYVVDLRRESDTYGRWVRTYLDDKSNSSIILSIGFAHGFLTTTDNTLVYYKMSNYYSKTQESFISFSDPILSLDIANRNDLIISSRDLAIKHLEGLPHDF